MKKKLSNIMILAMVFTFFTVMPAIAVPIVSLDLVNSGAIYVGDSFDVAVTVNGSNIGPELLGFGFDVSIDSGSVFSYTGFTIESGFDDFSSGPGNVAGDIFSGITDDVVLLATLSFTADAIGTDTLNTVGIYDEMFSGLFFDINGFDINASLDITVDPVPEPSTMILFGLGLAGLAGYGRKLKK